MKLIIVALVVLFTPHRPINAQTEDAKALMQDTRPEERIRGIRLLASQKSSDAIGILIDAVDDSDPFVRAAARLALREIGRPGVVSLLSILDGQDEPNRFSAANVLANLVLQLNTLDSPLADPDIQRSVLDKTEFLRCYGGRCLEKWVAPIYPTFARTAHVAGRVWLTFILEGGVPKEIEVKGHPFLRKAAVDALRQWRFGLEPSAKEHKHSVVIEFHLVQPLEYSESIAELILPSYVSVVSRVIGFID